MDLLTRAVWWAISMVAAGAAGGCLAMAAGCFVVDEDPRQGWLWLAVLVSLLYSYAVHTAATAERGAHHAPPRA